MRIGSDDDNITAIDFMDLLGSPIEKVARKPKTEDELTEEAFGAGLMILFDQQNGSKKALDEDASLIRGYVYND